ncbi:hypothetical protein, partial [Streptomyces sp. NPDC001537]
DQPPSDADLIGRMRSGDDTAYEELYLKACQSAQARIDGVPQAGLLGLAVRGGCIMRGTV